MLAALQAHHGQLQEYLSNWGKIQQEILCRATNNKHSPFAHIDLPLQIYMDEAISEVAEERCSNFDKIFQSGATLETPAIQLAATPKCEIYMPSTSDEASLTYMDEASSDVARERYSNSDKVVQKTATLEMLTTQFPATPICEMYMPSTTYEEFENAQGGQTDVHQVQSVKHFENALDSLRWLHANCSGSAQAKDITLDSVLSDALSHLERAMSRVRTVVEPMCGQGESNEGAISSTDANRSSLKEDWKKQRLQRELDLQRKPYVYRMLRSVVLSSQFEVLSGAVICINAGLMGVAADYSMDHLDNPQSITMRHLEIFFFAFYSLEVLLRVCVLGKQYCFGPDWTWNWFDISLVLLSVFDQVEAIFLPDGKKGAVQNVSFMRLLRLLKMAKLLRMIRLMKMFRELRLILNSILGSCKALMWAFTLIIIISYMGAICFVNICASSLRDADSGSLDNEAKIRHYWGTVLRAMNSLFAAAAGGVDWAPVAELLLVASPAGYLLFLVYIAFFMFVIGNTLTSLFVDSIMEHSSRDYQQAVQMELEKKDTYTEKLGRFFAEIDDDKDGTVTIEEFYEHADSPELAAFAASLEIDVSDAKQFFGIVSHNGALAVDIETFVVGCIKLKGQEALTVLNGNKQGMRV